MEVNTTKDLRYGIILGSNRVELDDHLNLESREMDTKYGTALYLETEKDGLAFIYRHGQNSDIPPHMINHRANIFCFFELGIKNIISFTSVGSLKPELVPGKIVLPSDYINFGIIPTYFDDKIRHTIPGLDNDLRDFIFEKLQGISIPAENGGIYIQTRGPRFETKAEIQMFKSFGDIMGMTMAVEATLAKELDLNYANVSIIDNYCNGISDEPLTMESIQANQQNKSLIIQKLIKELQSVKEW
jgi:5'-methylthioadenosine phosphorylase